MLQALVTAGASFLLAVFVPCALLGIQPEHVPSSLVFVIEDQAEQREVSSDRRTVSLCTDEGIINIPLEDYLVGVVFSEMPANFHEEALKSQAVAARTFALYRLEKKKHKDYDICSDHACCQAWTKEEDARERFGESYLTHWENAQRAVNSTEREVLTYEGDLVEAVYFSCSGGSTEDAIAVWGSDVPYLQSVESHGEEAAPVFRTEKRFTFDRFKSVLAEKGIALEGDHDMQISEVEYTDGGGVARICISDQWISGAELRGILGLNSAKFNVRTAGEEVVFDVFGYGHRVGMSQYGANAMAKAGADYHTILQHYYTDVTIEQMEDRSSP